jgi:hypothetical protein
VAAGSRQGSNQRAFSGGKSAGTAQTFKIGFKPVGSVEMAPTGRIACQRTVIVLALLKFTAG